MLTIKISSLNVRGIRDTTKRRKIFNYLHHEKDDVIMLQETHSCKKDAKYWRSELGGNIYFEHGETNSKGVAIAFRRELNVKLHNVVKREGRCIILEVNIDGIEYVIMNVYAPNGDDVDFFCRIFEDLETILTKPKDRFVVIGGDFNTILSNKDKKGGTGIVFSHPKCAKFLEHIMEELDLVDIWRVRNEDKFDYTWKKKKPKVMLERIDYLLISFHMQQYISGVGISQAFFTDHNKPWLRFVYMQPITKGPGYWKMNISYLSDIEYQEETIKILQDTKREFSDIYTRWEMTKLRIRGYSLQYAKRKQKDRNNKLAVLQKKIMSEKQKLAKIDIKEQKEFDKIESHMVMIQKDIEEILHYRTLGAMMRSKQEFYDGGEKSTAYFFNLEKSRAKRKAIYKIIDDKENIIYGREEILEELEIYYKQLFTLQEIEQDKNYLNDIKFEKVTPDENYVMEAPIQKEEIHLAIKQLNNEKCPGIDGIPIEWYKKFYPHIIETLLDLYTEVEKRGILHSTARDTVISLMDKANRDMQKLKNWRPLNLLECDYKVYAKVIANRLQLVMNKLVHQDQCRFMKGRNIAQNITDLNSVIEFAADTKLKVIITAVDFEKAFDSIEWSAIRFIMKAYKFSEKVINMVMSCFTGIKARVINNGYMSNSFEITRGTKQGCPLSSLIFNLVIEVIGLKFRQNQVIKPANIGSMKKVVSQYADDLWTAMKVEKASYREQLRLFREYKNFTGLGINYDKTEVLRVGSLRNTNAHFYSFLPIKWSDGPIKILGIHISDIKEATSINYKESLEKTKNIYKTWGKRSLTLLGRTQIVNTLVIPQFVYRMQALSYVPETIIKEFNYCTRNFLWKNGVSRIRKEILSQPIANGGVNLVNLKVKDRAIKFAIANKWRKNKQISWPLTYATKIPIDIIWKCNLKDEDIKANVQSLFVRDVLKAWNSIKNDLIITRESVLEQVLWYNSEIKCGYGLIFNQRMYDEKIIYIKDILKLSENRLYSYNEFCEKYGTITSFLEYLTLCKSIPKEWIRTLKLKPMHNEVNIITKLEKITKVSKFAYRNFIEKANVENDKARNKWEQMLREEISDAKWQKSTVDMYKTTLCSKLRWIQFRIMNHILTTNMLRNKWDKNVSPLCYFCQTNDETVMHLFTQCKEIRKKVWDPLKRWLKYYCNTSTQFHTAQILLHMYDEKDNKMLNTIMLIAELYIYVTKCCKEKLNFTVLIKQITLYKKLEEGYAIKKNIKSKHDRKWILYDLV